MVFFFSLRVLEAAAATTTRFGSKVPARELSEKLETGSGEGARSGMVCGLIVALAHSAGGGGTW